MRYDDNFELPIPEELTLAELLATLEDEVFIVASKSENYLATWRALKPETALAFLQRRRYDIQERYHWYWDNLDEAYAEAAPAFLRNLCWVAQEVENSLGALTSEVSSRHVIEQMYRSDHPNSATGNREHQAWFPGTQASFEKMLTAASAVRRAKLAAAACETTWTNETSKAIEEIRASTFADETAFLLNDFALPATLKTIGWRNHLAIKVPDEWLAQCESYVTHESPTLALIRLQNAEPVLALELASGTVRLDASKLVDHLGKFDTELSVLFIGRESCCLAVHPFTALVDGSIIEDFVKYPEKRELLPTRDKFACISGCFVSEALERFKVFDAICTERPLTDDPDEPEYIPF